MPEITKTELNACINSSLQQKRFFSAVPKIFPALQPLLDISSDSISLDDVLKCFISFPPEPAQLTQENRGAGVNDYAKFTYQNNPSFHALVLILNKLASVMDPPLTVSPETSIVVAQFFTLNNHLVKIPLNLTETLQKALTFVNQYAPTQENQSPFDDWYRLNSLATAWAGAFNRPKEAQLLSLIQLINGDNRSGDILIERFSNDLRWLRDLGDSEHDEPLATLIKAFDEANHIQFDDQKDRSAFTNLLINIIKIQPENYIRLVQEEIAIAVEDTERKARAKAEAAKEALAALQLQELETIIDDIFANASEEERLMQHAFMQSQNDFSVLYQVVDCYIRKGFQNVETEDEQTQRQIALNTILEHQDLEELRDMVPLVEELTLLEDCRLSPKTSFFESNAVRYAMLNLIINPPNLQPKEVITHLLNLKFIFEQAKADGETAFFTKKIVEDVHKNLSELRKEQEEGRLITAIDSYINSIKAAYFLDEDGPLDKEEPGPAGPAHL